MLTNIKSLSKKIYYYSTLNLLTTKRTCIKSGKSYVQVLPHKTTREPPLTLVVNNRITMTLTPLQINLTITFVQLALTW